MEQVIKVLGDDGAKLAVWLIVGIAILIGLALVVWLLMKMFGRSLNMAGSGRGQPQRLGITGAFNVDRKGRKLVIVRRDNVEHLVLIGGPNDVLVEANIIRAQSMPRPVGQPQAMIDPVEPALAPVPLATAAIATTPSPPAPVAPSAPPVLPPVPPVVVAPPRAPQGEPAPRAPEAPRKAPSPQPVAPRIDDLPPTPVIAEPSPPVAAPVEPPQPAAPSPRAPDPRLSDMAKRLQSVLQRPITPAPRPAPTVDAKAAAAAETKPIPLPSQRKADVPAEPAAAEPAPTAPPAAKPQRIVEPVTQGKPLPAAPITPDSGEIDSLEEEMARLLGRSGPQKT